MNIISFEEKLFPVNSQAWHKEYRLCRVVDTDGTKRTVRFTSKESLMPVLQTAVVDVSTLKRIPKISLKRKP